ncbi:MAG TPA: hypothetical protein VF592_11930 [Sphingomonas sp.]|jgi:hypothetical protein|uniref:hypothetical protein n=1 Tax=Sphingomonas sp. TaxID=28214 RepID=UPI002EDB52B3
MTDQRGGGLDLRPLGEQAGEDPGGTGGSSGGGTIAGAGQPSGGTLDSRRGEVDAPVRDPHATPRPDSLAGIADSEIAAEAAVLGSADGSLADASGARGAVGTTPSGGEMLGTGAGRGEPGSGTGADHSGLSGGDPLGAPIRPR